MNENRPNFINPDLSFEALGFGTRADASSINDRFVVKEVREPLTRDFVTELQFQYDLLRKDEYLGPYAVETNFLFGNSRANQEGAIFIIQPKISGLSLERAVQQARKEGHDLPLIKDFFERALLMYSETGLIPDFFGKRKEPYQWYNPLKTRNVLVTVDDEIYKPYLIDTNLALRARKIDSQLIHNPMMAFNIRRLLKHL